MSPSTQHICFALKYIRLIIIGIAPSVSDSHQLILSPANNLICLFYTQSWSIMHLTNGTNYCKLTTYFEWSLI